MVATDTALVEFVNGYTECALWSSYDDQGEPLDRPDGGYDLAPETVQRFETDCRAFMAANETDLDAYADAPRGSEDSAMSYAGHDLWLSRNGHGTGFWDRGLGELGERLSEAAHALGTCDLYIGDDGLIYAT